MKRKLSQHDSYERIFQKEGDATPRVHYRRIGLDDERADIYYYKFGIEHLKGGLIAKLKEYLSQLEKSVILDAGCGKGTDSLFLANISPNYKIIGVDISPSGIKIARSKATNNKDSLFFLICDITKLPFKKESFDAIYSYATLEHVADPCEAIRSFITVLKDRGILVIGVPSDTYWKGWYLPNYLVNRVLKRNPQYHAVPKNEILGCINYEMNIVEYDVIGFRPPENYLKFIPKFAFEKTINWFLLIEDAFRTLGLARFLYMQIFVFVKRSNIIKNISFRQKKIKLIPSLVLTLSSLLIYVPIWIQISLQLLRKLIIKNFIQVIPK